LSQKRSKGDARLFNYAATYPKTRLLWISKPEPIRRALLFAYEKALSQIKPYLDEWIQRVQMEPAIKTYLYAVLVARVRQMTSLYATGRCHRSSPLSVLRAFSFWLDEFGCPEETVWLTMTVPARVWFWLVVDEVKRRKFLDAVKEIFPEEIPPMEATDG